MWALGIDIGGTKVAGVVMSPLGQEEASVQHLLAKDRSAGSLVTNMVATILDAHPNISAIGVCVPGIYRKATGTVWAPNIAGWDDYPLLTELRAVSGNRTVVIDSDRTCSILGEQWLGAAAGCTDAIYLAVGTGIGVGILAGGHIVDGAYGSAGAVGWMALERPYREAYQWSGCFESRASGAGIAAEALRMIQADCDYAGPLSLVEAGKITASQVIEAYHEGDNIAGVVIHQAVVLWGMAVANLVSIFNPQVIVFGGGVFGPALAFLPHIVQEAQKWAQPVAMQQVKITGSALGNKAALCGAAWLAFQKMKEV